MLPWKNWRCRLFTIARVVVLFLTPTGSAHSAGPAEAERILQQARQALDAGRWDDAARELGVAEKASGDEEFQHRVAVVRRELFTVVRLEELRYDNPINAHGFDYEALSAEYQQTFRGYALEPEKADEEMKRRGRSSPIRSHLIAALDEWARIFPPEHKTRQVVLDFADSLDDSEIRHNVRAAVRANDLPRLRQLAQVVDVKALKPATLLLLEKTLDRLGESAGREDLLRRGQQHFPPNFWILLHLGEVLTDEEPTHAEEAVRWLRAALTMQPNDARAMLSLAGALLIQKHFDEAETGAREVIHAQPRWMEAHVMLVSVLHEQGKNAQADAACPEASRMNDGNPASQCVRGRLLGMREKWSDAEEVFRRVLLFEPDNVEAIGSLGVVLAEEKQFQEAEPLLREALRRDTEWNEVHLALGMVLLEQNHDAEAETHLRDYLRGHPGDPTAQGGLGMALLRQGRAVEADLICREAVRRNPADPKARFILGQALLQEHLLEQAEAAFREVLRLDGSNEAEWSSLAIVLVHQRKLSDAEKVCRTALKRFSDSAQLHNDLGGILAMQNRDEEAEASLREALRRDRNHAQARHNLVEIMKRGQRYEEAKTMLRQAVAANKDDAAAWTSLAEICSTMTAYEEAEAAAREMVRLTPDSAEARCNLALALEFEGRFEAALAELCQLKPDVLAASLQVSSSRNRLERETIWERQLPAILRGEVRPANAEETLAIARLCLLKNHPGAAVRFYEEGFRQNPQLIGDVQMCYRSLAAAAAVGAARSHGEDAPADEKERARLRREGLAWLREEFAIWSRMADEQENNRAFVQRLAEQWQQGKWFASVREAKALALLPAEEREGWEQLWRDVEALRQRTFKNPK
jgi:Flp pilus assembly protein TadD